MDHIETDFLLHLNPVRKGDRINMIIDTNFLKLPLQRVRDLYHQQKAERIRNLIQKKMHSWTWNFVRAIFILGFCFVILYPVLSMISKSFMHQSNAYDNTVIWIPKNFTLENITFAWKGMDYIRSFFNSAFLTVLVTFFQTAACMVAGYGFARFDFPLKKLFFLFVVFAIIIPPQQLMIPLYLHFKSFDFLGVFQMITGRTAPNLLDSYAPFLMLSATCMGMRNGLFVFIFRQAFRSMPKETEESAMVDGAGAYKTFFHIMMPNALAVTATIVLFSFVWQWNDTYYSGLFLSDLKTVTKAFQAFNGYISSGRLYGDLTSYSSVYDFTDKNILLILRNAGILLVMMPLLITYLFTQKYFVESIERTGLVG